MSPSEPPKSGTLLAQLGGERAAWQALRNLLAEEERALVDGEADRLAQLNASKLAQLQTLGDLARARHGALIAAGQSADHAGMDAWLARHGDASHRATWQQLRELESETRTMNQRVGTLIEMRLATTRQALNVLIHAATRQNGLYDEAGQSVTAHGGKPLTAA